VNGMKAKAAAVPAAKWKEEPTVNPKPKEASQLAITPRNLKENCQRTVENGPTRKGSQTFSLLRGGSGIDNWLGARVGGANTGGMNGLKRPRAERVQKG